MPDYRHDPLLNYNANLLKQAGTEEYTAGRNTVQQGVENLQPVYDYFKSILSGDTKSLEDALSPQIDTIAQQFGQVRSMISDQPRGGGKTSTLAQLPIEQIKALAGLFGSARTGAAQGASDTAQKMIGAGGNELNAGLGAAAQSANIAQGGRNTDISNSFRSNFLSGFGGDLAKSLSEALI